MAVMNEKMQDALNEQINAEMYSSLLYLSMSAYFESLDLPGFANWMRVQAKEEDIHVQKMFDYVVERGGRIKLGGIEKPPLEWESPLAVFEAAYAHEQKVSGMIHDLVGLASELKDRATESFLRWFVDEQVEEEASVDKVVKMLRLGAGQPVAMLMADRDLAARMLVVPPDVQA